MVVENPVTLVLYSQVPFIRPQRTLNVSMPAQGPQLTEILVGLILFDSIIIGTVVIKGAMQGAPAPPVEEDVEDEVELVLAHVDFVIVVCSNVSAPLPVIAPAKSLPLTVELPLSTIVALAKTFPTKVELELSVTELPTCQKTLQA